MENFLMFLRCKREKLQKLWLMSKWTFLFVFLGIINTHGTVYSQNEQQVTISMKNAYLKDILWEELNKEDNKVASLTHRNLDFSHRVKEEDELLLAGDDDDEEEEGGKTKIKFAPLAVFCTFFVAELGDKTQLTAITFGANEGMSAALVVWIGCSLGLFAADILGMLVGYLLKSKTPDGLLNTLAFVIFSVFGVYTLYQGLKLIGASVCLIPVWPVLIAATVVFAVLCVCLFIRREKKAK